MTTSTKRLAGCALALFAAVFAVFSRAGENEFVALDTSLYITQNQNVLRGLSLEGLTWAFTTGHAANWHPLTWLSHMLDVELFGTQTRGHHLMNAGIHALNSVLCLWLFVLMTGALGRSLCVALWFAFHPMHVESVAWIVERKDVLSGCFGFAALIAYQAYARARTRRSYIATLVLVALALMSKPMMVTLPCVMLLLDFWPLQPMKEGARARGGRAVRVSRLVVEKLPFFALAAASSVVTYLVQEAGGATSSLENLSLGARSANAIAAYGSYVWKLFWPVDLSVYYPLTDAGPGVAHVLGATAMLIVASGLALVARARRPYLFTGWFWFLGTLVPVIGLVHVGGQSMADRYTYWPYVGLFVAIAWGVLDLAGESRGRVIALGALASLTVAALAVLTWKQIGRWRNTQVLCEQALAVTEDNYVVHDMLGFDLLTNAGDAAGASEHFREALRISPRYVHARYNLGIALEKLNRIDEAVAQYEQAFAIDEHQANVLQRLVTIYERQGKFAQALQRLDDLLHIVPERPAYIASRGQFLLKLGRLDDAERALRYAIQLAPQQASAHFWLGQVLAERGRFVDAEREFRACRELDPKGADAPRELARALHAQGRAKEALVELDVALRARPDWPDAVSDIAWILATTEDAAVRDPARALALANRAVERTNGRSASALDVLAAVHASAQRFDAAVQTGERALARAKESSSTVLAERIERRLAGYRRGVLDRSIPR